MSNLNFATPNRNRDYNIISHESSAPQRVRRDFDEVSVASSTACNDLVCQNCVNKTLMDQKRQNQQREFLRKDQEKLQMEALVKKEAQVHQRRAEEQREFLKKAMLENKQQALSKSQNFGQEKRDCGVLEHRNHERELMTRAQQRQDQIRETLQNQIAERNLNKLYERYENNGGTSLQLESKRWNYGKNYGQDIKEQIMINDIKKARETENDRKESYVNLMDRTLRICSDEQDKAKRMEQRKESLKATLHRQFGEKEARREKDIQEKQSDMLRQKESSYAYQHSMQQEYKRRKEQGEDLSLTLKTQMEVKSVKRMEEIQREKNFKHPAAPADKSYKCNGCEKSYPKKMVMKSTGTPMKYSPSH